MKTLQQVEPRIDVATLPSGSGTSYIISNPGSYYLSDDITVTAALTSGITIYASNVTLDLNGFTISNTNGESIGVSIASASQNTVVKNGHIHGFQYGIQIIPTQSHRAVITDLTITGVDAGILASATWTTVLRCDLVGTGDPGHGIYVGDNSVIRECTAKGFSTTNFHGIQVGRNSVISNCSVTENSYGIGALSGSRILDCSSTHNTFHGIASTLYPDLVISGCNASNNGQYGIYLTEAGEPDNECAPTISNCAANQNGSSGIYVSTTNAVILNCLATANASYGIFCANSGIVQGCTAKMNAGVAGIYTGSGSLIKECRAVENVSSSTESYGIFAAGQNSMVINCLSTGNSNTSSPSSYSQGVGISCGLYSKVLSCEATGNEGDGILVTSHCEVRDCMARNNGSKNLETGDGAGIHTFTSYNVIVGNTVTENERGIDVDSENSLVTGNVAFGNVINYTIANNNRVGTIVLIPSSGTISGSSGGAGAGTTDPWANFAY